MTLQHSDSEQLREDIAALLVEIPYPLDEIMSVITTQLESKMIAYQEELLADYEEDVESKVREATVKLDADLARAMGLLEGLGHRDKYLLERHPDLAQLTNREES